MLNINVGVIWILNYLHLNFVHHSKGSLVLNARWAKKSLLNYIPIHSIPQ